MLPEDRLQEAIKQVKLAEMDDPTTGEYYDHYRTIEEELETQLRAVKMWRQEVDDTEVVE